MNKKIIGSFLTILIIVGSTSFTTFASMDNGCTVIGNKAFDLTYANDPVNFSEITDAIILGGAIYVKNFNGNWIDNATGYIVPASVIPAVVYKSDKGEINFDSGDTSVPAIASIELGDNIFDNSIIANAKVPVYRLVSVIDSKDNEMIPNISKWTISTINGTNNVTDFASIVYYKHDNMGNIIDTTIDEAEGIAVKFDPSVASFSAMDKDTTLLVTVGDKAANDENVIKDSFNVIVRAKSLVKSISLADSDVSIILGTRVKKELVVFDQYGKVITDPSLVDVVYGVKTTASISYDVIDKKMYITYNGEAAGTDTIVVQAKANHKIIATANISIYENTASVKIKE